MASSTPLRPLELPPFSLHGLLAPVFVTASSSDGVQLSPSRATPRLINQLIQGVTGTPATTSTGVSASEPPSLVKEAATDQPEASTESQAAAATANAPAIVVKAVEAGDNKVYIGSNDGRIKICQIDEDEDRAPPQPMPLATAPSARSSPPRASALRQVQEVVVTHGRKAADRIALLHRLDKAVVLSEGILAFHSMPTLTPLNVHSFPAVRGCITFSLDEAELAGGGDVDSMHICVVRRRSIQLLKITSQGVSQLKDLPLSGTLMAVLRGRYVCTADKENYSIIDLDAAVALPLLPISQTPNPEFEGTNAIDPKQRPAIACAGSNEFLIASHTGPTTLGVFVTESGDPCRGTLEWASNLRSLGTCHSLVDPVYSIALLHNNTIEVHSLKTQAIAQVVQLPNSPAPSALQPRSLAYSWSGLDLGVATGAYKTETVMMPLLPRPATPPSAPATPKKGSHRQSVSSMSLRTAESGSKGTATRTIVVGRNSLFALTPMTLVAQADALFDKGRAEEALDLAQQAQAGSKTFNVESAYVLSRAAFHFLEQTLFQKAFELFEQSRMDPRWLVRMFDDLKDSVLTSADEAPILRGLQSEAAVIKSVDDYILDNLNRNYSPHIKPDVETAGPTVEIRTTLMRTARDSLMEYLKRWRKEIRATRDDNVTDDRTTNINEVVDTALARLLAEPGHTQELVDLLKSENNCSQAMAERLLAESRQYTYLAERVLASGRRDEAFEIWKKLYDGDYVQDETTEDTIRRASLERIFEELHHDAAKSMLELHGFWLVRRDRQLGVRLFTEERAISMFNTRELLDKLRDIDAEAAELVLEHVVLRTSTQDEQLHTELANRYLDKCESLMSDAKLRPRARLLESEYQQSTLHLEQTLLSHLLARAEPDAIFPEFERARLRLVIFLSHSNEYSRERVKTRLEEMEKRGLRGLTLERAIVYGKLQLDRQALSLLVNGIRDLTSAEVYCQQGGDPLIGSEKARASELCNVPISDSHHGPTRGKKGPATVTRRRRTELSKLLIEMSLLGQTENSERDGRPLLDSAPAIARILEAQASSLEPAHVLSMLPDHWPLSLVTPFFSSTLRRSLHDRQEATLFKALASSQNLRIAELYGDVVLGLEPTTQNQSDEENGGGQGATRVDGEKGFIVELRSSSSKGKEPVEKGVTLEDAVELGLG
ncbi:hypothetical protein OIV83_003624 [Microbotryomycetes sp. JL201]|nr:hypothetical protein OIV83_003624 [Microbotryomycetes sp. JL201]